MGDRTGSGHAAAHASRHPTGGRSRLRDQYQLLDLGYKSKEGLLPSDYWRRNLFAVFQEDEVGVQLRHHIGIDTMLWGNDFPHSESTWPKSREFLDHMFAEVPAEDRRKLTCENAARLFRFTLA